MLKELPELLELPAVKLPKSSAGSAAAGAALGRAAAEEYPEPISPPWRSLNFAIRDFISAAWLDSS